MMHDKTVLKIREFNRLYLPVFELLGNRYLGSEYSATEARVLFEIFENDGCNAVHIAKKMNIDKSYLSRILKSHEKNHYIIRTASKTDLRAYDLHLTPKGLERTKDFIEKSNIQVGNIIRSLNDDECKKMVEAIDTIIQILQK